MIYFAFILFLLQLGWSVETLPSLRLDCPEINCTRRNEAPINVCYNLCGKTCEFNCDVDAVDYPSTCNTTVVMDNVNAIRCPVCRCEFGFCRRRDGKCSRMFNTNPANLLQSVIPNLSNVFGSGGLGGILQNLTRALTGQGNVPGAGGHH